MLRLTDIPYRDDETDQVRVKTYVPVKLNGIMVEACSTWVPAQTYKQARALAQFLNQHYNENRYSIRNREQFTMGYEE